MKKDSPFDPDVLDQLERQLGPRVLGEVIDLFCTEGPRRLQAFEHGQRSKDLTASAEALHSLRGSAAMLGLRGLDELTSRAEELARNGDADGVEELVTDLEVACSEAIAFLRLRRQALEP